MGRNPQTLDPHAHDGALIQFQSCLTVDHHDDAQFLAAIWAERTAVGGRALEAYSVFTEAADHELDQPAFTRLEIAE